MGDKTFYLDMLTTLYNLLLAPNPFGSKKADVIASEKLLDGVCVFITNHIERQGRGFKVNPHP